MKKLLRYAMVPLLVFLCGSGMAFSRAESVLHEWCGIILIVCVVLHLTINRRWFQALRRGHYSINRGVIAATDFLLIALVFMIAVSSIVISGNVFSPLNLSGAFWGRRIHMVATAWLLLLCGVHYGMHLKGGKTNVLLYLAGATGIAAFVVCRFYERLFLLNEFAYLPNVPEWAVYLLHALMFAAFMVLGNELNRLLKRKGNTK